MPWKHPVSLQLNPPCPLSCCLLPAVPQHPLCPALPCLQPRWCTRPLCSPEDSLHHPYPESFCIWHFCSLCLRLGGLGSEKCTLGHERAGPESGGHCTNHQIRTVGSSDLSREHARLPSGTHLSSPSSLSSSCCWRCSMGLWDLSPAVSSSSFEAHL